jgi:hypothetical protein
MLTNIDITLPELQTLAIQLPTGERWALLKTLIESLQPEIQSPQSIDLSSPSTNELMVLAHSGGSFDFLNHEPDLYTINDGEPVT